MSNNETHCEDCDTERGPDCAACRRELVEGEKDFCGPCLAVVQDEDAARGMVVEQASPIVFMCGQCYRRPGVTEVSSVSRSGFSVATDCCVECARALIGRAA